MYVYIYISMYSCLPDLIPVMDLEREAGPVVEMIPG